jgi:Phage Tail Collar Domain
MTPAFPSTQQVRRVVVDAVDIDNGTSTQLLALVRDLSTNNQMTIPMSAPARVKPQEGDTWQLARDLGYWSFDKMISPGPTSPVSNLTEVYQRLRDLGLMAYEPGFRGLSSSLTTAPEAVHAAYVGEVRAFYTGTQPPGWILAGGQSESRLRYRNLFAIYGTLFGFGDGDTTFGMPSLGSPDPSPWVSIPLNPTWSYYGTPWGAPRYRADAGGIVRIEGLVTSAIPALPMPIFTLPPAFRPATNRLFITAASTSGPVAARLDVYTTGDVSFNGFASGTAPGLPYTLIWLSIECSFATAAASTGQLSYYVCGY